MPKLPTRTKGGIMSKGGLVHRDTGSGYTVCGRTVENPISVSDNQIFAHKLNRCHKCFPSVVRWAIR